MQVDRLLITGVEEEEATIKERQGAKRKPRFQEGWKKKKKKKYNQQQRQTLKYLLVRRGRGQLIEPRPRGCHRPAFVMFSEVETWASDGK